MDFIHATITVGKSKTRGGEGRPVPLNDEALEILVEWHSRFPDAQPDHYVFPSERYGFDGEAGHLHGAAAVWGLDPTISMGSMKSAWTSCRKAAGVWCRLHDLRHTFISALGEAGVPESTMKAIAGWMSAKMLERYSTPATKRNVRQSTNSRAEGRSSPLYPRRTFGVPRKSPTVTNYEGVADKATPSFSVVGEAGLEPTTPGLEGRCSIQLSYSPTMLSFYFEDTS